jgi:hypothetical protein
MTMIFERSVTWHVTCVTPRTSKSSKNANMHIGKWNRCDTYNVAHCNVSNCDIVTSRSYQKSSNKLDPLMTAEGTVRTLTCFSQYLYLLSTCFLVFSVMTLYTISDVDRLVTIDALLFWRTSLKSVTLYCQPFECISLRLLRDFKSFWQLCTTNAANGCEFSPALPDF